MDLEFNEIEFKKEKKKKHDRSHSESKHKKKDKDQKGSKEHKKKDKDKKHHKDKDRERQKSISRDRSRDKKSAKKQRDYQADKHRSREYDRFDRYDRDKDRDRKYKDRRQKSRERRSRSRDKKYSIHKDRKKYDNRDRGFKKEEDTFEKWKRQKDARFRFDSPPKSDQSEQSEDIQKMNRLSKIKAEKELVSSKADKKLYLGNLPPNITSNQLMDMLNTALKKMDINTDLDGDSIVSAWVSPDGVGHYAFVQFRTAQEATQGLALNGASLYGYQLKLGRPKQYIEYQKQLLSEFGSDGNIDTIIRKVQAMGGFAQPLQIEERLVPPPSKVIVLKHIVTIQELSIDEEYEQIVEDVTEMAKRFGDVVEVIVPRPKEIDLEVVQTRVKGLGFVFIKYKRVEQARFARRQFVKKMFSERSVACSYFPQNRFEEGDLDPIEKIIIDF